jgi:hypothetical protein
VIKSYGVIYRGWLSFIQTLCGKVLRASFTIGKNLLRMLRGGYIMFAIYRAHVFEDIPKEIILFQPAHTFFLFPMLVL